MFRMTCSMDLVHTPIGAVLSEIVFIPVDGLSLVLAWSKCCPTYGLCRRSHCRPGDGSACASGAHCPGTAEKEKQHSLLPETSKVPFIYILLFIWKRNSFHILCVVVGKWFHCLIVFWKGCYSESLSSWSGGETGKRVVLRIIAVLQLYWIF